METLLLIVTFNRFDLLERLLFSVQIQTRIPDHILIVDNSGGKLKRDRLLDFHFPKLDVITSDNIGLASAWNLAFDLPFNKCIITNEDTMILPHGIEAVIDLMDKHQKHPFFTGENYNFKFWAMHPIQADELVGRFDDAFYPAYYEDVDYWRRMQLAGLDFKTPETKILKNALSKSVVRNESSGKTFISQMQRCIDSNDYRYKQKWGGGPGNEVYMKPFNMKKFCVCGES